MASSGFVFASPHHTGGSCSVEWDQSNLARNMLWSSIGAADDAHDAAQMLSGLAALIDPDDPDGLPNELSVEERAALVLTSAQLSLLRRSARYREVERAGVAREVRRIAATIAGQIR